MEISNLLERKYTKSLSEKNKFRRKRRRRNCNVNKGSHYLLQVLFVKRGKLFIL